MRQGGLPNARKRRILGAQASATSIELSGPDSRFGSPGTISVSAYNEREEPRPQPCLQGAHRFLRGHRHAAVRPDRRGCERLARRKVRCPDPAPSDDADVAMGGGNADDRLRVDDTVAGSLDLSGGAGRDLVRVASGAHGYNSIFAGPGRDRILAGAGGGTLWGGTGRDEIYGGPGDETSRRGGKDLVRTGEGDDIAYVDDDFSSQDRPFSTRNRIYLGPGIDEISASNGHRDGLLNCGRGGDDEAIVDAVDSEPRSCEIIQRRRGSR